MTARFYVDTNQASSLAGFLKEVSVKIGTPQYIGPVLQYVHSKMSDEFSVHMSAAAKAAPERFHHVYEWGGLGDTNSQLWQDVLRGNSNVRMATFIWKASTKTVPVRADFQELGVQQVHIFTWKAPVMEFDTNIRITPKRGSGLSYYTGPTNPVDKWPVAFWEGPITVQFPGGREVKGAFTHEYVNWWAGSGAAEIFANKIRRLLEHDLADMPLGTALGPFRSGTRSRSKTAGFLAMADAEKAEEVGKMAARAWLAARSRSYISGAVARAAIIGG